MVPSLGTSNDAPDKPTLNICGLERTNAGLLCSFLSILYLQLHPTHKGPCVCQPHLLLTPINSPSCPKEEGCRGETQTRSEGATCGREFWGSHVVLRKKVQALTTASPWSCDISFVERHAVGRCPNGAHSLSTQRRFVDQQL